LLWEGAYEFALQRDRTTVGGVHDCRVVKEFVIRGEEASSAHIFRLSIGPVASVTHVNCISRDVGLIVAEGVALKDNGRDLLRVCKTLFDLEVGTVDGDSTSTNANVVLKDVVLEDHRSFISRYVNRRVGFQLGKSLARLLHE